MAAGAAVRYPEPLSVALASGGLGRSVDCAPAAPSPSETASFSFSPPAGAPSAEEPAAA
jgi:hypothetical protein